MAVANWDQFKPSQIVFLERGQTCLYGEVIQVVPSRQLCWVRPLALVTATYTATSQSEVIDLRCTSDLIWPASLFQLAIDTQVIPLIAQLTDAENLLEKDIAPAKARLHRFIAQVWSEKGK